MIWIIVNQCIDYDKNQIILDSSVSNLKFQKKVIDKIESEFLKF